MPKMIVKTNSRESARKVVENLQTLRGRNVVDSIRVVSKNYEVKYHKVPGKPRSLKPRVKTKTRRKK